MPHPTRYIGSYTGNQKGNLFIAIGAMHGNEPAGVHALTTVFSLLEKERQNNPNFTFRGKLVGLIGNMQAYALQKRFIQTDLNREFTLENIQHIFQHPANLQAEAAELYHLLGTIQEEFDTYQPKKLIFLDIHTTSAGGGIFAVPSNDTESERVAMALHVPVIKGLMDGLSGTSLHYFNSDNMNLPTAAIAFETGAHTDPTSANRAVSGIINCLRSTGFISKKELKHQHDALLKAYSTQLPKLSKLIYIHTIQPKDDFKMCEGFTNFQPISKGEWLANDRHGKIFASQDCLMLMPLYQPQGNDGFFLIEEVGIG
jgi:succinylglutamate desuccinylase